MKLTQLEKSIIGKRTIFTDENGEPTYEEIGMQLDETLATVGQTVFPVTKNQLGAIAMFCNGILLPTASLNTLGLNVTYDPTKNSNKTMQSGDRVAFQYLFIS